MLLEREQSGALRHSPLAGWRAQYGILLVGVRMRGVSRSVVEVRGFNSESASLSFHPTVWTMNCI